MGPHVVINIEDTDRLLECCNRTKNLPIEAHQIELVGRYLLLDCEIYRDELKQIIQQPSDLSDVLCNVRNSLCHQHIQYLQIITQLISKINLNLSSSGAGRWPCDLLYALLQLHEQIGCFEAILADSGGGDCGGVKEEITQTIFKLLRQSCKVQPATNDGDDDDNVEVVCAMSGDMCTMEQCLTKSIRVKYEECQQLSSPLYIICNSSSTGKVVRQQQQSTLQFDPVEKVYRSTIK